MKRAILLAFCLFAIVVTGRAVDVVFVANTDVADAAISADDVKNILLGNKTKWDGGGSIKVVVLTEGPVHEKVIHDFTQRTPDQFDKYWKKLMFTGKGMLPASGKTDAEAVDIVAKTPGAFGYVAKESVTAKVKVLNLK